MNKETEIQSILFDYSDRTSDTTVEQATEKLLKLFESDNQWPTDEEIQDYAWDNVSANKHPLGTFYAENYFIDGAKWMRNYMLNKK